MCRQSDYPPYDSDTIEVFDSADEDGEDKDKPCEHCSRYILHKTDCPNYIYNEPNITVGPDAHLGIGGEL